ncbi:hypothetical protein HPB48_018215 [Haemaphysalis longicornis]|uniref:Uncharacterized protein n=1 Tax=Haemaphysalis longicornis TaxID=44386 RepID=A0A9J6FDL3_HAELO|nr:hypothetical protein HPB48_018215 [Haemaphysalis longicornis]
MKLLLLLSHGQASVERGFSINKQVAVENLAELSYISQRVICEAVKNHGGLLNVPIPKELKASVRQARHRYAAYLDKQKKQALSRQATSKRKELEQELDKIGPPPRFLDLLSGAPAVGKTPSPVPPCGEPFELGSLAWLSGGPPCCNQQPPAPHAPAPGQFLVPFGYHQQPPAAVLFFNSPGRNFRSPEIKGSAEARPVGSHFKNGYQLHELRKSDVPEMQWIFSATGHGKDACDGVGGIVKHQATLYNLREPLRNAIQTAKDMVTVLSEKIKGVHFIYLEGNEVSSYRETKKEEWRTLDDLSFAGAMKVGGSGEEEVRGGGRSPSRPGPGSLPELPVFADGGSSASSASPPPWSAGAGAGGGGGLFLRQFSAPVSRLPDISRLTIDEGDHKFAPKS